MRTLYSLFLILFSVAVHAQEAKTITTPDEGEKISIEKEKSILSLLVKNKKTNVSMDKVCYAEISKVNYYEALISVNNLNINLKNSTKLAIKNTEEIITKKRDQILYSENE